MQVAPAPTTAPDAWAADTELDRANRKIIIAGLLDPGPYLKSEDDKISDGLRLVDTLTNGAAAKHGVVFAKHKTHTPLQEAFMCHDKLLNISYGKMACTVRGASALDVAAVLADFDSKYNKRMDAANPSVVKACVLERSSNHHWVFYYQFRSPPPFLNRDFVWSFIVKRLSDDQYVCVLQPTLHDKAPITVDVVRAESTRIYRITKISESVAKLELFVTVDLKGSVPSWITRNIVIPTALSTNEPHYMMQIKEYEDYDKAGDDAKMLGQLLMDMTRSLGGVTRDAAVTTFFSRTAALRHLSGKLPWLVLTIVCIVENKIRPPTTSKSRADNEDRLISPSQAEAKASAALEETAVTGTGEDASSLSRRKTGMMAFLGVLRNSMRKTSSNKQVVLGAVTPEYAIEMGQSFALTLLSTSSPEAAVDEWIVKYQALFELDQAEPTLFRPFVVCIAKNLLERSTLGAKMRVLIGALLSVLDMISDILMIFQFVHDGHFNAASATIAFIVLNMLAQCLIVYVQNKRRPRHVFFREVLIVVSCLKPGIDAARIIEGGEKDPLLTTPVLVEMVCSKGSELALEAVPGSILQCSILISSPKMSSLAIFSLCISSLSAAYTATTIFFDFDTDVRQRRENPSEWGAIPDTGRGLVFFLMVLISALQMTAKVFSVALLATTNAVWLVTWLSLDMAVYLIYRVVRNDFFYVIPGTTGATKYLVSLITRTTVKIIVSFTGFLNGRVSTEMGGIYYSFDMILSQLSCWVVAALYIAHHRRSDKEAIEASNIYLFIGGLQSCWFVAVVLCLWRLRRKYLRTFFSTETARQHVWSRFSKGIEDEEKMGILSSHTDLWAHFHDQVKAYSLANWERWEEERPAWFNENFKANVPDEFIPRTSLDALNKKHGGKRRRSSIGGGILVVQ